MAWILVAGVLWQKDENQRNNARKCFASSIDCKIVAKGHVPVGGRRRHSSQGILGRLATLKRRRGHTIGAHYDSV